ncbi:NAD-dependent epimerase/dehydratase family protein [Achromobacter animicus]|uniref:NAD-dependent epimerase/dehydratase family protein n=1 Tax=Achromobacter animicus TaxID=1389935 RepID=UPI00244B80D4|nr:SDR family oxidoreductase [Achromobacter animicus]MDH0685272.1 SDR family oxidoreductase [Achromobacter animicus]
MTFRVLVTGASGYAGGVLAQRLRAQGMEVVTAGRAPSNEVQLDLSDPASLARLALPKGLDACVHAAAMNEVACRAHPELAYVVNVAGTRALLDACERASIARHVYVSTFHVFGQPAGRLDEESAVVPGNDYGLTHWQAEQLYAMAARARGVSVDILRPANLYGRPAQWADFDRWTLAPFDFCRQAVNSGRIVLHGLGLAMRNYLSVEHLAYVSAGRLMGPGQGVLHVAGTDWQIRKLALLAASCATELLGRDVTVAFGDKLDNPAVAYQFASRHEAAEGGDAAAAMAEFLSATLSHLNLCTS